MLNQFERGLKKCETFMELLIEKHEKKTMESGYFTHLFVLIEVSQPSS